MNKSPERIRGDQAEEPEDNQDDENRPKHIVPISQATVRTALVPRPEIVLAISQGIYRSEPASLRLYSCAHFQLFSDEVDVERGAEKGNPVTVVRRRIEVLIRRQLAA